MNLSHYLLIAIVLSIAVIIVLIYRLRSVKTQISVINDTLEDMKKGNLNRRVLADNQDMTQKICHLINEIAIDSQAQLIRQKQSERAYKRLMTSLSHDVKTPLASLLGYLEAIENKIVDGEEKDEYIRIAFNKASSLKDFVQSLFEWVQLDTGEQVFHFENCDINELSRNIIADWIPILENNNFSYEINIPEKECPMSIDVSAYTRIIDNLLQNIINHSAGSQIDFALRESETQIIATISDNGKGISESDLPHIFERLYTGDYSRRARGNGLGLAIAKELVTAHKGTIIADSKPGKITSFHIAIPKFR